MKLFLALLSALSCLISIDAGAQGWPAKPLRMIIPWPPGGGNDILGRLLAEAMAPGLGQQVVVDNRGGASGLIGAEAVARAAPDGYTIMFHSATTHMINQAFYEKLPYDTMNDFASVALIGEVPHVLITNPALPVKSVRELAALARRQPGELSYASFGIGSSSHLSGALFNSMVGVKLTHVPYKGGGPALIDTIAGHVPLNFATISTALPSIKAGKVKVLAVTTAARSRQLPEVPTIDEAAGVKGYETSVMFGVWVPAKTPEPIITRLNAEIGRILKTPAFGVKLEEQGVDRPMPGTPAEMTGYIRAQQPKWTKAVKESGARAE
jgi:tripartite-type tricarboxylate transporter receptor subunit TctC